MSSDDDGEGADPHRGEPTRSQQQPQPGPPSDGTQRPAGATESPPGGRHGAPSGGSGTTRPVGGPTTSEQPGAPPPPYGAAPPPPGPGATSSSGPGATPPTGPGATSSSGPGATPPTGAGATSSAGPGATPPPGPSGSPYDQPPGAMPPPSSPYGGPGGDSGGAGAGYGGAAYGAPDPRLAGMPPLAGLGRRLLARIIDGLVVYIPVSIFLALIGSIDDFGDSDATGSQYGWGLFGILVYLVYEGLMLTRSGQTVGKKLMSIRVGMLENGSVPAGRPGWIRAAVYSLPGLVPCLGTLFWLYNVLSCTWDKPYRQCVHDKAARTVVVSTEGRHFTP